MSQNLPLPESKNYSNWNWLTVQERPSRLHLSLPSQRNLRKSWGWYQRQDDNQGHCQIRTTHRAQNDEESSEAALDLFSISGVKFLLSVALPLDLVIGTHLSYKKTNEYTRTVVKRHIEALQGVHRERSTGWHGLDGIDVEVVGAGMHVGIAYRKIRVIKDRI